MTQYQVVGQCAHVTVAGADGTSRIELLYKGSFVPQSATAKQIQHLLSLNAIAAVGGEPVGTHEVGAVSGGTVRAGLDGESVESVEPGIGQPVDTSDADAAVDAERAAAREKLASLGGEAPDGRASKAVHVEYLVSRGHDYATVAKAEKAELVELTKQRSQS